MNFKDPRGFVCMILAIYAIPFLAWGFADADPFLFGSGLVAVVVVGTALALNHTPPHGRGRTLRSRVRRRLAWLLVAPVRDCGCFADTGAETIESDPYLRRERSDGAVTYTARKRRLRRCHDCGQHYHDDIGAQFTDIDGSGALSTHAFDMDNRYRSGGSASIWPEDEPEVYDAVEVEIEDAP